MTDLLGLTIKTKAQQQPTLKTYMTKTELKTALQQIGLALSITNNTVTTDIIGVEPNEASWRINHDQELALLDEINNAFFNTGICPVCNCHNTSL